MKQDEPFAEVIESSLHGFLAQSWDVNRVPSFGSLMGISTSKRTMFGVVHQIQTGSMDPGRHPFAYQKTEEELRKEQPQIFEFLKTTFATIILGYKNKQGTISYLFAPEPARIHAFVYPVHLETCRQFFMSTQYMHALFGLSSSVFNLDELLLAIVSYQSSLGILSRAALLDFITTFSLLSGNDYRRLKLFLQRVEPLVSSM